MTSSMKAVFLLALFVSLTNAAHYYNATTLLDDVISERGLDSVVLSLPNLTAPFDASFDEMSRKWQKTVNSHQKMSTQSTLLSSTYTTVSTSAQYYLTLNQSDDKLLYLASFTFNPYTSSSQTPDQVIDRLILDTGGADTLTYNKAFCQTEGIDQDDCLQTDPDTSTYTSDYRMYFDFQYVECELCYFIDQKISVSAILPPSTDGFSNANVPNAAANVVAQTTASIIYAWSMYLRVNEMIPAYLDYTQGTGFAGLGFTSTHPSLDRNNVFAKLASVILNVDSTTFLPSIGLDLNVEGEDDSKLWLDGTPEQYRADLQMAPSLSLSNHVFTMKSASLCGHTLFTDVLALIDSATPCTSLPSTLFEFMVSWLPVICEDTLSPTTNVMCFYDPADPTATTVLPTLDFYVADDGAALHVPLDRLLMPLDKSSGTNHPDKQRLCLNRDTTRSYITVGNMMMSALYVQLDLSTQQVGFANKVAAESLDGQCLPRQDCVGMQTSYTGYNGCINPDCSTFFLFSSTANNTTCEVSIAGHVILALGIALFLTLDVLFFVGESLLGRAIKKNIPHMTMREGLRRIAQRRQQHQASQANMLADVAHMR